MTLSLLGVVGLNCSMQNPFRASLSFYQIRDWGSKSDWRQSWRSSPHPAHRLLEHRVGGVPEIPKNALLGLHQEGGGTMKPSDYDWKIANPKAAVFSVYIKRERIPPSSQSNVEGLQTSLAWENPVVGIQVMGVLSNPGEILLKAPWNWNFMKFVLVLF